VYVLPIHGSPSPVNAKSRKPGQKFTAGVSDASEKLKAWKKEQTLLGFCSSGKGNTDTAKTDCTD